MKSRDTDCVKTKKLLSELRLLGIEPQRLVSFLQRKIKEDLGIQKVHADLYGSEQLISQDNELRTAELLLGVLTADLEPHRVS